MLSGLAIILIFPNPVITSRESLCNICNCESDLKRIVCGIGISRSTFKRFNFCLGNAHLLCRKMGLSLKCVRELILWESFKCVRELIFVEKFLWS